MREGVVALFNRRLPLPPSLSSGVIAPPERGHKGDVLYAAIEGLDVPRVQFAAFLVATGRISDAATTTTEDGE